jgi:hypothetical protein
MTTHLRYNNAIRTETDQGVIETLVRKGWEVYEPEIIEEIPPTHSANEWLASQGYDSVILIALLDLENKLKEQNKSSSKLTSVRNWINGILSEYISDSEPKSDWQQAPFAPQETIAEAFAELNDQNS